MTEKFSDKVCPGCWKFFEIKDRKPLRVALEKPRPEQIGHFRCSECVLIFPPVKKETTNE